MSEAENKRPPEWLFKNVINPTMRFVLKSPLHGFLSDGLALLTFTGRKSGKEYRTPVAYHGNIDGADYMIMTRSSWWKNLQDAPFSIRIQGTDYDATGDIIGDDSEVLSYLEMLLERYDGDTRKVGIMIENPTDEQIRHAANEMTAIKIHVSNHA